MVQVAGYLGLVHAVAGWLNEVWLQWTDSIFLSHDSEYMAIAAFGVYRVAVEKNLYTRKRIAVLTAIVVGFWGLAPSLFSLAEPGLGFFGGRAILGQGLHLPMTLTFFISLALVLLFERRAVCPWNCPCVDARDTMGTVFRQKSIKSQTAWKWHKLNWKVITPRAALRWTS